jgi:glyoxylase-like metal-dependent hydrolase (beta-lactamase superfamily II)
MPRERIACGLCVAVACITISPSVVAQSPTVGKVQQLASDVYFYEGDISKGHCTNGCIVFQDNVLAIDANIPSGARDVITNIRELTKKPFRFAFHTHHHGDDAYGNQVWLDEGATAVAHMGVLERTGPDSARPAGRTRCRAGTHVAWHHRQAHALVSD